MVNTEDKVGAVLLEAEVVLLPHLRHPGEDDILLGQPES